MSRVKVVDQQSIKVTVDSAGLVWYLDGFKLPVSTGLTPKDFITASLFREIKSVSVVGLARNADLLLRLCAACRTGIFKDLNICSPLCCNTSAQRNDPSVLLYLSRDNNRPVSTGGWRPFTEADLYAYSLCNRFYGSGELDPESITYELTNHPVWPALKFINGLNSAQTAKLIGLILDPRWFVDRADPDRTTKLPQFLGLEPKSQAGDASTDRADRYKLVLSCWKNTQPPSLKSEFPAGAFLWRSWYSKGGGNKGDLLASKVFVNYLRQVWTACVSATTPRSHLFIPEYFFHHPDDVRDFRCQLMYEGGAFS